MCIRDSLEEIEAHHHELNIKLSFNRKPVHIQDMISVPEDPTAYPWGKSAENLSPETVDATVVWDEPLSRGESAPSPLSFSFLIGYLDKETIVMLDFSRSNIEIFRV